MRLLNKADSPAAVAVAVELTSNTKYDLAIK